MRYRNTGKLLDTLKWNLTLNTRGIAPLFKNTDDIETLAEAGTLNHLGKACNVFMSGSFALVALASVLMK